MHNKDKFVGEFRHNKPNGNDSFINSLVYSSIN